LLYGSPQVFDLFTDPSIAEMALILIATLILLLGTGLWVGLALLGTGIIALALFSSRPIGDVMTTAVWATLTSWTLISLPLFIWMGEILYRSKVAESLFSSLAPWIERIPGRLLQLNVVGSTLFAAISGSSAATCATVGKISLPELRKRGYPEYMVISSLVGSGTLGLLIPPSIIMIVYGVAADVSISKLFIAGILPGLLLAGLFMGYVGLWAIINHQKIPPKDLPQSFLTKMKHCRGLFFPLLLIFSVLSSIYSGIATATQAAAIGVVGALLISTLKGSLTRETLIASILGASKTTTMIMLILAGSAFLSVAMGFTGIPGMLVMSVAELSLSQTELLVSLTLLFIFLGCFLDGISMIVLTMAVLLPVVKDAGFDPLWFGIYIVLVVEMAQITPPVGLNLYVLQGMTKHDIGYISRTALPSFILIIITLALVYLFPEIATLLPTQM